jgi:hypothetical protein
LSRVFRIHLAFALLGLAILVSPRARAAAAVNFDRDIRPILSDNCFHCHGPDPKARKAKLRLDTREGLYAAIKNRKPFVPGKLEASEAIRRIFSKDADERMPPSDSTRKLSVKQMEQMKAWVEQGAKWQQHWAFEKPVHPAAPKTKNTKWSRNDIDRFVLARLEAEGLSPAAEADKRKMIRRVTLDLTGLPPTPAEVAAFVADGAPTAYEKVVDRLFASPRYGERMAWDWLDAARYADSNGYQGDNDRTMWPWRDWVIRAMNKNMPYDQFLTWQLAGDLLPSATLEQKLATAFNRNHMINGEGGRIAEENRVEYIFDQVETIGTTWLGLTMTCCRCHDHKYDPLTQKNYYQMFAYFNKTRVDGGGGNPKTPPVLSVPPADTQQRVADLQEQIDEVVVKMAKRRAAILGGQAAWEKKKRAAKTPAAWEGLTPSSLKAAKGQKFTALPDGSTLVGGPNPKNDTYTIVAPLNAGKFTGLRIDALRHMSMTIGGASR